MNRIIKNIATKINRPAKMATRTVQKLVPKLVFSGVRAKKKTKEKIKKA